MLLTNQKEEQTLMQVLYRVVGANNIQWASFLKDTKYYRLKILKMCFRAKISLSAICGVSDDLHSITGQTLGGYRGLADLIPVLHANHDGEVKRCIRKCFKQFSITHDGTPHFSEAFGCKFRGGKEDLWEIK
jgi:hypothetical protein